MPYLKLQLLSSGTILDVRDAVATLGRDPGATVTCSGDDARVVSTRHAELRHQDGGWVLVDLESRNGSYLNGRRVQGESPVAAGDEIRLGETGPRLTVVATNDMVGATLAEHPAYDMHKESSAAPAAPPSSRPPEARPYGITLIATATGKRFEAKGTRIRLGRGKECEVRPVEGGEGVVSRVHAELTVGPSGGLSLRDVGSKNGTYLNGDRIQDPKPVRLGDRITLGPGGPVLVVEGIGTGPMKAAQRPAAAPAPEVMGQKTVIGLINSALEQAREERRRGGRGSTAFLKAVAAEVGKDSRRKFRWITASIVVLVLLLGAGVFGVYQLLSQQVAQTEVARRSSEDSSRADAERLRQALDSARAQAAPAATVDSLRVQLESAQARTAELSQALGRAQSALTQQLTVGETQRQASQRDLQRLRDQLTEAQKSAPSSSQIDSLRRQVSAAEAQTASLDARMRAVRGTDFATIAQQNQGAVGLITVSFGKNYYNGTGFVISADGYMLTNWHVVTDSGYPKPDTIWVTMADQAAARFADVVVTSQDRDIAVIKVRMYQGPYLSAIDWGGTKSRQGEPAALIGYPAGAGFARYRSTVVRTSMTAGIISRVTDDVIQFDGMTVGGSSGSPVFNANGEVISIHRAGLPQAPGFALSVPIRHAVPLLPADLKQRLGIQ
ncbi:MAG TPA: FHA domain-containing protein [Gemmatimonadales bacterium]|nr:FHA domain-containing protein [Gemmatimonadales bacterium]